MFCNYKHLVFLLCIMSYGDTFAAAATEKRVDLRRSFLSNVLKNCGNGGNAVGVPRFYRDKQVGRSEKASVDTLKAEIEWCELSDHFFKELEDLQEEIDDFFE